MKNPQPPPGPGPCEILSGSPVIGGSMACMRPGVATTLSVSSARPWNAMMKWDWDPASGGEGFTLTSDTGTVLMYTPDQGLNVQLQPAVNINKPAAAWIPVSTGQTGFFAIVSAANTFVCLTILDGGPPWTPGQIIDAEGFDPGAIRAAQAWMFVGLGEDGYPKAP